jgi:hypothetical protein
MQKRNYKYKKKVGTNIKENMKKQSREQHTGNQKM